MNRKRNIPPGSYPVYHQIWVTPKQQSQFSYVIGGFARHIVAIFLWIAIIGAIASTLLGSPYR